MRLDHDTEPIDDDDTDEDAIPTVLYGVVDEVPLTATYIDNEPTPPRSMQMAPIREWEPPKALPARVKRNCGPPDYDDDRPWTEDDWLIGWASVAAGFISVIGMALVAYFMFVQPLS